MTIAADAVRSFALSLPGAEERRTWGHETFRVGGRIFASLHDDGTAVVKASSDEQDSLVARAPGMFRPAPRVGRHGWVAVELADVDAAEMRAPVRRAYDTLTPGASRDVM